MARRTLTIRDIDDISIGLQFTSAYGAVQLERIAHEIPSIDGTTSPPPDREYVTGGGGPTSTVESAVIARTDGQALIDNFNRLVAAGRTWYTEINAASEAMARWRAPALVKQIAATCHDGQLGKDGVLVWGDTPATDTDPGHHCLRPQEKSGMCLTHYMRWYRHTHKTEVAA